MIINSKMSEVLYNIEKEGIIDILDNFSKMESYYLNSYNFYRSTFNAYF